VSTPIFMYFGSNGTTGIVTSDRDLGGRYAGRKTPVNRRREDARLPAWCQVLHRRIGWREASRPRNVAVQPRIA
jgi:hypothetical protein